MKTAPRLSDRSSGHLPATARRLEEFDLQRARTQTGIPMPTPKTTQRAAIESAIDAAWGPVSPTEILETAREEVSTLSLATVYRTLKRMIQDGELTEVGLSGQPPRYERTRIARVHHHHFWCQDCDTVFDLKGCVDGLRSLLPRGFSMTGHEITLRGQCRDCRQAG